MSSLAAVRCFLEEDHVLPNLNASLSGLLSLTKAKTILIIIIKIYFFNIFHIYVLYLYIYIRKIYI